MNSPRLFSPKVEPSYRIEEPAAEETDMWCGRA